MLRRGRSSLRTVIPDFAVRYWRPARRLCQDDAGGPSIYVHPVLRGVVNGGCYGSVLLDNDLWQSLTAMNGHDVPWVYGCVLDHGHDADHGAPAYEEDGEQQQWLRWADMGAARLERVETSAPGRHSKPLGSPPAQPPPQSTVASGSLPHRHGEGEPTATRSNDEALWAIAAAIERLAEAVSRLGNLRRDNGVN